MPIITAPQPADYGAVCGILYALRGKYPFLRVLPLGESETGRPIQGVVLGEGNDHVLMAAAFHGQEWITSLLLLRLCEELCAGLQKGACLSHMELRRVFSSRSLVLLPQINPDGVEIALHGSRSAGPYAEEVAALGGDRHGLWQANARGVDINHNFDAGWETLQALEQQQGIKGPSPRQWGGPAPESERETRLLTALCRRQTFRHVTALHTQGEEIYWEYGPSTPPCSAMMAEILSSVSGYTASRPGGLASHGGFKDWFIEETGCPGFTIECGRGVNPLPIEQFEDIYRKIREMLLLLAVAM